MALAQMSAGHRITKGAASVSSMMNPGSIFVSSFQGVISILHW
jgi:hypothetical protein